MIRESALALLLLLPVAAMAADPAMPATATPAATTPQTVALPPMKFYSSVAADELLLALQAEPALASLDKELPGSPLALVVTHTLRPTAGGVATGFLSAVLSGSTLGLIPLVTNDRLVVRYEVMLNGKAVTSYSFERTATRAQNLWTAGADGYGGLGKAGMEWVKSTAAEVAAKLPHDPALGEVREEIDFYFPSVAKVDAAAKPAQP
jgi:hypothetical protein